jgi:hypothetical protein
MEHQKTFFTMQQQQGDTSAWWANYTDARPTDYQVPWTKFRNAFRAHHIPTDIMKRKYEEFMSLKQG